MDFEADIIACIEVLERGGTILFPTDTVWGIGCDATNPVPVKRIFQIKKRPEGKAMVVLVPEEREVLKYVAALDLQVFDYLKTVSKPTTVVYKPAIGLAENLISDDGSAAIRICHEPFCKALLKRFRKPIVSTSANISGEKTPENFSGISEEIKKNVDYVVKYRQEEQSTAVASSIIQWEDGDIKILRS